MIASLCVSFLPAAALSGSAPPLSPTLTSLLRPDDKALYMEHCASCHGETGDGKGTADLDRSARSFLDGGYSYGNTKKAVLRSVVHGIPGTPMPAFGETLPKDQLEALAAYVIALGPPGTVVEPGASVLSVGDRPMVVNGMMPALGEGGRREPRSLLVGFPNGTTFQYRKATAQLTAIRQGDFLDRRDWGGRGGAALEPLGQITWSPEKGSAKTHGQFLALRDGEPQTRVFKGSRIQENGVALNFDVLDKEGNDIGGGQEFIAFKSVGGVPVAMRSCLVDGVSSKAMTVGLGAGETIATLDFPETEGKVPNFTVSAAGPGVFALIIEGYEGSGTFIHAAEWTDALEAAIRTDILDSTQGGR